MLKFRGVVQFVDGSEEPFETGNAALAAYERYAARNRLPMGKDAPPILSSMVIAHHALAIAEGFDVWAENVQGVELKAFGDDGQEIQPGEASVPPTPSDPSTV